MYTNFLSLSDTWGQREAEALTKGIDNTFEQRRLDKQAQAARSFIDSYLAKAGYVVPLVFTEYGYKQVDLIVDPLPNPVNPTIQRLSDCLTAYFLANSDDLKKKAHKECYEETVNFLENLLSGKTFLSLEKISSIVVLSRPRVFTELLNTQTNVANPRNRTEY